MNKRFLFTLVSIILVILGYFFIFKNKENIEINNKSIASQASTTNQVAVNNNIQIQEEYSDAKTFIFDEFHGSKNIDKKFKFLYPSSWQNDGHYFSPEKIEYYDLYSVKAPIYFDLIRTDIFNQTEFKYQIDQSKRVSKDSIVKIDGFDFKKYDLIDYGSYGGESAGRVIIYVGPRILIDETAYFLVFHWEEKPLTINIKNNYFEIFEKLVLSTKFF